MIIPKICREENVHFKNIHHQNAKKTSWFMRRHNAPLYDEEKKLL